MKVYGYARVSTAGQAQDGVSLEMQKQRIEAWSLANGHELAAVFVETGSGARSDNRPQLNLAVAAACKNKGILVVYSLSRFSRSVKDTLILADQLERSNAHLASLTESLDTSSPVGRMVFKILSTLAEFEREQGAHRTIAALSHLRRANRRISSKIPFGYTLADDNTTLVLNAGEQAAIARMVGWRAGGMTLAAIAKSLEAEGVKTREGGRWFPATVAYILQRQQKLAA
jgi:DNA invertase Pin-like site-specific DNA recombinase